jgi:UDP-N-acetylglucosamine 3-dehydrogenase
VAGGQLAAVCDLVEERAKPWADQFGVPFYTDLDEMLDRLDFDLLVTLTNMESHCTLNLRGLQAGRHVYTQKPMTVTVKEATTLIEEAAKRDLKLVAEESAALFPEIRTARKLIDEGVIGKGYWIRSAFTH